MTTLSEQELQNIRDQLDEKWKEIHQGKHVDAGVCIILAGHLSSHVRELEVEIAKLKKELEEKNG